jgi:hypothetical protein
MIVTLFIMLDFGAPKLVGEISRIYCVSDLYFSNFLKLPAFLRCVVNFENRGV